MADKNLSRIRRQFDALGRAVPSMRRFIDLLTQNGMRWLRVPVAFLLMAGGLLGFLPVLGFWMLPLGFLLLAIDIPLLRPAVATTSVRARRRFGRMLRRSRGAVAHR